MLKEIPRLTERQMGLPKLTDLLTHLEKYLRLD